MDFIHQHPTLTLFGGYYLFSALVGGMPTPMPGSSSSAYTWAYNSLHLLAGNITEAFKKKYPQLPEGSSFSEETKTTVKAPSKDSEVKP